MYECGYSTQIKYRSAFQFIHETEKWANVEGKVASIIAMLELGDERFDWTGIELYVPETR